MKIIIFGDSFGLPRFYKHDGYDFENFGNEDHGKTIELKFDNTYPEVLRKQLTSKFSNYISVENKCQQVYTSFNLVYDIKTAYLYQPDYIIVQVGIVDCWSRPINAIPPMEFMRGRNPWVSFEEFKNNIYTFTKNCITKINTLKAIILVNISKTTKDQYDRHLGSLEQTLLYNNFLFEFSEIIKKTFPIYLVDMFQIT